jgi:hypothetical protein
MGLVPIEWTTEDQREGVPVVDNTVAIMARGTTLSPLNDEALLSLYPGAAQQVRALH